MSKKEFDCHFHIDINKAWCGAAYFIKPDRSRTRIVSIAAVPGGKANASKASIKETLELRTAEMAENGWIRVEREEMYAVEKELRR